MTYDPMRDLDEERDAYYPFQRGYEPRGSSTPYVVAFLALAILAVIGLNIAGVDDAKVLSQDNQTKSEPRVAARNSASFN